MWVGTQNGLIWFSVKTQTFGKLKSVHPPILDSFPITTQFEDSYGIVWMGVGVGHGLVAFDSHKKTFTVYNERSSPAFPLRYPTAITEDKNGNLWMGAYFGGGLVEWKRSTHQFTSIIAKHGQSFQDSRINDLFADNAGHIWIATTFHGLLCYDMASGQFRVFDKGLSQEEIYQIEPAQSPYLWVSTPFGLNRFNMYTGNFESFFKKDGLPTDEFSPGMYYDTSNGKMYVGFKSGLVVFNALGFSVNNRLPYVILTSLLINNQALNNDPGKPISLDYTQNNLTVNYTAIDLVDGPDLKFRYRLNNEDIWNDAGKNREIQFSNLSPGNYSLLIEVENKVGKWNENAAKLDFYIKPPFWKSTWFYLLAITVAIIIVYLLYKYRIRQLQGVHEMRNRIAQDLHDDIGGTITAINLTNEIAIQNLGDPPTAKKLLRNISEDLKTAGESLDDIVWAINPKNDSMPEMMARMRRYASCTWEAAGINFNFEFETNTENIHLNMEQRHDLYLIFKEAVNNVAKHSTCTYACSSLLLNDNALELDIKDNGKGFDPNALSNRNGLKNMQTRIQKWKGEIKIISSSEMGTSIWLLMPVTQKGD